MTILDEAKKTVEGQRQQDYGDMTKSFNRIASFWSAYTGKKLTSLDVANMMILLKVSRAANGFHHDSYVDIVGYVHCAEKIKQEQAVGAIPCI